MPNTLNIEPEDRVKQPGPANRITLAALVRSPLAQRAALIVFVTVLLIEVIILLPSYQRQKENMLDDLVQVALQWTYSQKLAFDQTGNAQAYASSLLLADTIVGVAIYDKNGKLDAVSGEAMKLAGAEIDKAPSEAERRSDDGTRYERIISGKDSPIGTAMVLHLDSSSVDTQLFDFVLRIAGLTLIISAVLTIATLLAVGRLVLRPLLVLQRTLAEDNGSDFAAKAGPEMKRSDEIGETFRTIATLLEDLEEYREDLGQLVLERTMDLTSANQRLRTSEAKLRSNEERIRAIMDNSPSYIYLKSVDGRYLLVNKHVEESLGLPAEEIIGKRNEDFYPPELSATYSAQDQEVIATRAMVEKEIDVPRSDGSPQTSIIYKFPVFSSDGDVESIGAVIIDITARKVAEAEVAEQSRVLRKVLDNIDNGVLMLDGEMRVETYNDRHLSLYGIPPDKMVIGETIEAAMRHRVERGHYGPGDVDELTAARLDEISNTIEEHARERTIDGRVVETRWSTSPDGSHINVATDVTQRKENERLLEKAKNQAERAAQSRAELVAIVSHEVRTPMNGVLGMARLLQDTEMDSGQRDMVNTIVQSGDNLVRIVSDLLDVSKIEAGRFDLELSPFIAADVMEQCISVMTAKAQEKGLRLHLQMTQGIPVVLIGDPFRIRQIITNLISNAIRFTSSGSINVAVTEEERTADHVDLGFSVRDTGVGIREEDQVKLFTPYEQGSVEMARKSGGTGLGLAICSYLVQQMGGYIYLDSVYGEGSTFRFTLRFPIDKKTPAYELRQAARKPRGIDGSIMAAAKRPLTILQVEDDLTNQKVVDVILTRLGHTITTVPNGSVALRQLEKQSYDVIIMDRHMPVMDGLETTKNIRAMSAPICDTPIVGVTAGAIEAELDMCRNAGMDTVLTKPVDSNELISAIVRLTGSGAEVQSLPTDQTVLVVDDVSINRAVARQQLEKLNIPYLLAESGAEALGLLESNDIGLALVDIAMPVMDGLEFTRHVRDRENGDSPRLPLIAMTGYVTMEDRARFMNAGMDDCLTKPVVLEDLAAILGKWLDGGSEQEQPATDPGDDTPVEENASPIDLGLLGDILGEDDEAEKRAWVQEFITQFPPMLDKVVSDTAAQNRDALNASAHAAKSAANSAAATPLAESLAALEHAAREAEWPEIETLLATVHSRYESVLAFSGDQTG